MPGDWKEALQNLQEEMDKQRIKELFDEGKFREVLENLSQPRIEEEKNLIDQCNYNLMKEACAERQIPAACDYAKKIVSAWLKTEFEGGRHTNRINKIKQIEEKENV